MNDANTKELIDCAPTLYEKCKYFECGDGWFDILHKVSARLETIVTAEKARLDREFTWDEMPLRALQVKEKFGTLRFYMTAGNDEAWALINAVESISRITCERCGDYGTLRKGGWIKTLCDACQSCRAGGV